MSDVESPAETVIAQLRLRREVRGSAVVISAAGEVDLASADGFEEALRAVLALTPLPDAVVVDLSGVEFISSVGLSKLVFFNQEYSGAGTRMVVVPGEHARRVIELTGLDRALHLADSVQAALS